MEGQKFTLTPEQVADLLFTQGIQKEELALKVLRYTIDNDGILKNRKGEIIGKGQIKGRYRIQKKIDGKKRDIFLHRLQAFQKYGREIYKKGIMVRHLDGNPKNNSWDNIAIGTARDNAMDIPKEIRIRSGRIASAKTVKYGNVDEIRKYHIDNGNSYIKTMEKFGISSRGTLYHILKKRII